MLRPYDFRVGKPPMFAVSSPQQTNATSACFKLKADG